MIKRFLLPIILAMGLMMVSCNKDGEDPVLPPVNENPSDTSATPALNIVPEDMPYPKLSDYNLYIGDRMADLIPNEGLLLYEPISQLFTDYAEKTRYLWMPEGASANYVSDFSSFDFPEGTVLIKNFYYENALPTNDRLIMETRMLFKQGGEWKFADYIWNDEQNEAFYNLNGASKNIEVVLDDGRQVAFEYKAPSEAECLTCHKISGIASPNGPKPQNLFSDLEYQEGVMNQLMKWAEVGYLSPDYPADIQTVVDWKNTEESLTDRVRAYLDANCSHCHAENAHCSYRNIRFDLASSNREENLGICVPYDEFVPGQPTGLDYIIDASDADASMMIYRMLSTEENVQMPLIGKSLVHQEGADLLIEYVNSLPDLCQ
jgi:uncharacterized repeat protein (TIGR03806 family)